MVIELKADFLCLRAEGYAHVMTSPPIIRITVYECSGCTGSRQVDTSILLLSFTPSPLPRLNGKAYCSSDVFYYSSLHAGLLDERVPYPSSTVGPEFLLREKYQ